MTNEAALYQLRTDSDLVTLEPAIPHRRLPPERIRSLKCRLSAGGDDNSIFGLYWRKHPDTLLRTSCETQTDGPWIDLSQLR